ncbi:MAG: AraC family transcriptional regulator [Acidobacteriaceae bacterium]|jgi:AraC family transcriptional regulator of arabinose operon
MARGPHNSLQRQRRPSSKGSFQPPRAEQPAASDPRITMVLQAIEHNPFATIHDLSRLVNLSHSRLSHLFKAEKGISLNTFLSNHRVERAAHLLRSTEMRIKEITYGAGYKQVPSFVRAFQRRFGASPTRYRRQRLRLTNSRFD